MRSLVLHLAVYVVVNAVIVFLWMLTTGSPSTLESYIEDPADALTPSFWPIFSIVLWGAVVVLHAVVTVTRLPARVRRARRRSRQGGEARSVGVERRAAGGPALQRVTVMFTDIAGSTALAHELGDEGWAALLAEHRSTVRHCLAANHGTEVGTQGDGFLVRFGEPDAAVGCAIALQRQLAQARCRGESVPHVRIGLHTGEAVERDDDLVGRVVNLASRVVDAASPDEILLTEGVADHLRDALVLQDRGLRELKGIPAPRHLLAVDWQEA